MNYEYHSENIYCNCVNYKNGCIFDKNNRSVNLDIVTNIKKYIIEICV